MSEKTWELRNKLWARMKTASSKHHPKKREAIKTRWYAWVDRFTWIK